MKRLALFLVVALNFIAFPAWAEGEVILDRLTKEQAEELNIVIPNKTPPGFHSITIEVYDDNGVIKDKEIPFCKGLRGQINWDNKCPDVVALASFEQLMKIKVREDLPPYAPAQEPEKSSDLQIGALAALAALAGAKKNERSENESEVDAQSENQQEELTSIESGKLLQVARDPGWGDRSSTWLMRFTPWSDSFFTSLALLTNKFSPLVARTSVDGSYLRAIFGGYSLSLYPLGALLGVKALIDTRGQAMAPVLITILLIVALAVLDAFAGFVAASIFFVGTLIAGNVFSRSEALTVLGLMAIFFAPALLASAIRPLRRLVHDSDELWERITDYALTILLTGWIVEKMINALNGLAGVQLAVTYQARTIAIVSACLIALRIIGEDVATYLYPVRLESVTVDLPAPSTRQQITSGIIKTFFFVLLATPYVGFNPQLILAGIIFVIPMIAGLTFADKLPRSIVFDRLNPKGTLKFVLLAFVGTLLGTMLQENFADPTEFLKWCFVIVAIPGFLLSIISWFADSPAKDWKTSRFGRVVYRLVGVGVLLIVLQIVRGADLTSWLLQ
ncbi:MAG: hypothetical protein RL202_212 [Actinomycetota bacterium]|jgi:hypothetical protein